MPWIFVQIDIYTLHIAIRIEWVWVCVVVCVCVLLDCHHFEPILIWLPDWNPMWLVKNVLEWTFSSQRGEPICHVARSAKIFNKQFDTWIYFKCVCVHNTNNVIGIFCEWSVEFGAISISFSSIWHFWFNPKLWNIEKTKEGQKHRHTGSERESEKIDMLAKKMTYTSNVVVWLLIYYLFSEGRWQARNMANRSFTNLNNSFFNQAPFSFISWTFTVVFVNKFNEEIFFRD